ncbi:hypothetical protein [Gordonia humi]|uniref:Uncharacterized protein n=1 Tax=Gordonia humi TaxID=686429 RepID=A0A840EZV6_9ACTN|nr:hypothetical protein [Gordonia humi]MBB4135296.1 hypothetical protein [Gordonia humi]
MSADVEMPVMLGLRTRSLHAALAVLLVAYVVIRATAFGEPRGLDRWVLEAVAVIGFAAALRLVVAGNEDPMPPRDAWAVAATAAGAVTAAWWAIPDSAGIWVQPGTAVVVFSVIAGLLALRGRAVFAWLTCTGVLVIAVLWALQRGGTVTAGGQITLRMVMALLPATLMAVLVRPMIALTGALEARRAATVRTAAVTAATAAERAERLHTFGAEVRPYLMRVVDGDEFDAVAVEQARLLENDLRDAVRGGVWRTPQTRATVASARRRGIVVRLLDDSPEPVSVDDARVLQDGLRSVLDAVTCGVVTARILPPGRDSFAVLTVVTADGTDRAVCERGRGVLRWSGIDC